MSRVAQGDIDYVIVTSPNNPTGKMANELFLRKLLEATDALVMVDEAYFEFSRFSMRPYLESHKNLVILRTFSKAFSLAGVRLGYILANQEVINEFIKVRQPYSVDAISQAIGKAAFRNRALFEKGIDDIISQRSFVLMSCAKFQALLLLTPIRTMYYSACLKRVLFGRNSTMRAF